MNKSKDYENGAKAEEVEKTQNKNKKTCLVRCGCLIKERALQRGSLMEAPCFSSCVANPPSVTAQPPAAFSMRSCNNDAFFSLFMLHAVLSPRRRRFCAAEHVKMLEEAEPFFLLIVAAVCWVGVGLLNMDEIAFRFLFLPNFFFMEKMSNMVW